MYRAGHYGRIKTGLALGARLLLMRAARHSIK
jgi:hypothetical protein